MVFGDFTYSNKGKMSTLMTAPNSLIGSSVSTIHCFDLEQYKVQTRKNGNIRTLVFGNVNRINESKVGLSIRRIL